MHEYIIWISLFAYAMHVFEEKILNWKKWAEDVLKFTGVEWSDFYVANAVVLFSGIAMAMVGWRSSTFALILPSLQLINGIFFHILPTVAQKRFSPGVITSVFLFLPIAIWSFIGANQDNVLNWWTIPLALIYGAALMSFPLICIWIKNKYKSFTR